MAGWCQDLGLRQISIAAWLLTQSPAPLGHLFLAAPAVGRAGLRETLSTGALRSRTALPATLAGPGIVKDLDQAVRSWLLPWSLHLWVRDRCSFQRNVVPRPPPMGMFSGRPRAIPYPGPCVWKWEGPLSGPGLGVGRSLAQEPQMAGHHCFPMDSGPSQ